MSNIEKRIGSKIREIRLSKKITQARLAEKVDVSVESISRLERGVAFPSLKKIETIACFLDVPLKFFFEFDDHEVKNLSFETELSKLVGFLRNLSEKEINLTYKILKMIFKIVDSEFPNR